MRKFVLLLTLFGTINLVSAQQLEVKVIMGGDLMPLAYILKNDKPVTQTNRDAVAYIDKSTLEYGDRLTSSYIGASSSVIVYSKEIERQDRVTIELTPDFELDEIVVSAEVNGWEIFQKYSNIPLLYEERYETKLDFIYTYRHTDHPERTIQGTALINKENSRMTQWNYEAYEPNLVLRTADDTTGMKQQLLTDLFFTLQVANGAVYRIGQEAFRDPDSRQFRSYRGRILFSFLHKGIEKDERIFVVTNDAYEYGSARPLRYLFRVSTRNKHIRSSESIHLMPSSQFNRQTSATYELYRLRFLKPRTAELESVNPDTGEIYTLSLNNIKYNNFTRRERKEVYPKETFESFKNLEKDAKKTRRAEKRKIREQRDYYRRFY